MNTRNDYNDACCTLSNCLEKTADVMYDGNVIYIKLFESKLT